MLWLRGYGGSGLRLRTCMVDSKVWVILAGILLGSMIHWACGKGPVSNDSVPQLLVHPDTLDYGQERTSLSLTISNGGQGPLNWSISIPSEGWVEANQTSGTVLNTPTAIDIRIDREKAPPGEQQAVLVVTAGQGGREEIVVRAQITHP